MITRVILTFLLSKFSFRFRGKYLFFFEIFSIFLTFISIYYCSKAVTLDQGVAQNYQVDNYFKYVIIGEVFLWYPFVIIENYHYWARILKVQDIWFTIKQLKINQSKYLSCIFLKDIPRDLFRILTMIILSTFFFRTNWNFEFVASSTFYLLLYVPIFVLIGMISSTIYLTTGRGLSLFGRIISVLSILSGTYFPVEVISAKLKTLLFYVSPFNQLLEIIHNNQSSFNLLTYTASFLFFIVIYYIIKRACDYFEKEKFYISSSL